MRASRHAKKMPTELLSLLFMPAAVLYLELFFRLYFVSARHDGFGSFLGNFLGAAKLCIAWISLAPVKVRHRRGKRLRRACCLLVRCL